MDVRVLPKPLADLESTRLLQQTNFWSQVKRWLGWKPLAFNLETDGAAAGDVLILQRKLADGASIAYAPFGPERLPSEDNRGPYLAALSSELKGHLESGCLFVRWDLPWISPYAEDESYYDDDGVWKGPPETRLRELRMNWGVPEVGLRKSPDDILPPDTIIVDLNCDDDALIERMKPKTRYNIKLAHRHGVNVREGGKGDLPLWEKLYAQTAHRHNIQSHDPRFFESLFNSVSTDANLHLLIAEKNEVPLAAMFLSVSADGATYLYGASSGEDKQLMAPYALQWAAMKLAKANGCVSYDLFGVAPRPDPDHPLYGLSRFKSGFGGKCMHRSGAWDFPYDEKAYSICLARQSMEAGFHL